MGDVQERFADALHNTARAWRLAVDARLKYLGVSQASWMTIAAAARARSPLSQSELAVRLGVEGATMVAMIDRLVKAGLVVREPSAIDRRIKRVVLTAAGRKVYETVEVEATAVRKDLLAQVDSHKLEAATEVLESLQSMIEAMP